MTVSGVMLFAISFPFADSFVSDSRPLTTSSAGTPAAWTPEMAEKAVARAKSLNCILGVRKSVKIR